MFILFVFSTVKSVMCPDWLIYRDLKTNLCSVIRHESSKVLYCSGHELTMTTEYKRPFLNVDFFPTSSPMLLRYPECLFGFSVCLVSKSPLFI